MQWRIRNYTKGRLDIINTWATLVGGQIVNKIEDDEVHIRKVLGFPENENPEVVVASPIQEQEGEEKSVPIPEEEQSTEMRQFAVEHDAVWVELSDGQRVAIAAEDDHTE